MVWKEGITCKNKLHEDQRHICKERKGVESKKNRARGVC